MAPITKTLALAGAFFALTGYSAPVAKRAVVWETVTDIVWTTVDVTTTVYAQAAHPTTVVPVVANAVPTTTAAPVVEASTKEVEKAAPTTTSSSTTTAAPAPTVEAPAKQVEQAAPTTTSTTAPPAPPAPPAPTVEAETSTTPAPVVQAETSSTAAPTATRSANTETTSSGRTGVCSEGSPCDGEITFYDTATTSTNPSSCGTTNDGTVENVLALPHGIMADGDCGKTVTITYNGQTATGIVVDKCMGCDNSSVDLSRHLFGQLAPMDKGRVSGAKWYIH
ncbi:hypothetical protein N7537_004913 [Penicillium hordei]|uniref:Allergen Asp f 7 n=1 Tax=Penicillium hordei TaxID=40994 RepID=A0AAD6H4A6_9EURO|nr:uncharacterized protein N7537_004913 [Penicillium hordei]KAJ5608294.1 hypothetical protein N7537_004913 [Penicillium hordei]